jgi:pyrroloquinoline quinone biosynthesis protein E
LIEAERVTNEWKEKLAGRMRIFFVVPDYHENKPKRCMNGWGEVFLVVTPDGTALPCHTARMLPGLDFPNVRDMNMGEIWRDSDGFNRYRGDDWMEEPCRSCERKGEDHGGCRCQAFMLTGNANAADPVCVKSAHHHLVEEAVTRADHPPRVAQPLIYRDPKESRRLDRVF